MTPTNGYGDGGSPHAIPEGRSVRLDGRGTTHVREVAAPSGAPTVVLLHGLGATSSINWYGAFEALAPQFGVVALDQRGHGRGIRSSKPFRLRDCADDVVALADVLGLERVIVVGYSMGGPIAMLARRRHPARVAGLVMCATAARFAFEERDEISALLDLPLRLVPPLVRRAMADSAVRLMLGDAAPPALFNELRRHDPAPLLEALQSLRRFDARRWAPDLGCPAASVVTAFDQLVPPSRQLELAELLGAEIFSVNADHSAANTASDRFLPALAAACLAVAERADLGPGR